jgi:MarR family transcriptional regulator for hemolysin
MKLMKNSGIQSLGFLLHDAARLVRKRFETRASVHGLSSAQWRLLVNIVREEGAAQARLAELLEIEPISVSRLLDRMEQGGWVERRPHENDRRIRMIYPTEKSRCAFAQVKLLAGEVYEEAQAGMSDKERTALKGGLEKLIENLSKFENQDEAAPSLETESA